MDRKLFGALLVTLATSGCCACDNSCDYLPPVLDGPYSSYSTRSGSAGNSNYEAPTPDAAEEITPLPAEE